MAEELNICDARKGSRFFIEKNQDQYTFVCPYSGLKNSSKNFDTGLEEFHQGQKQFFEIQKEYNWLDREQQERKYASYYAFIKTLTHETARFAFTLLLVYLAVGFVGSRIQQNVDVATESFLEQDDSFKEIVDSAIYTYKYIQKQYEKIVVDQ